MLKGERLNNFRYVYDTVIFADTAQGLQLMMNRVAEINRKYDLEVNIKETKMMIISKEPIGEVQLIPLTTKL